MHAQILLLIPIVWIIYAWTKTLQPAKTTIQKRKDRKARRKNARRGNLSVFYPVEDDFMFSADTDFSPDPTFDFPDTDYESTVFTDDDDYLTDITYSYMIGNIYHHED